MTKLAWAAPTRRVRVTRKWGWAALWTVLAVAIACAMALQGGHGGVPLVFTALAFGALTLPYMAFGTTSFERDVARWLDGRAARLMLLAGGVVAIYLAYAFGTGSFDWSAFARLTAFVTIPTALVLWAGDTPRLTWQDALAVFCIWVPFDTGLLSRIWAWPEGEGAYIINTSLAIALAVTLFVGWRKAPGLRFRFAWSRADLVFTSKLFLGFCVVGLPFGFLTGFITWNPQLDLAKWLAAPLGIFFFIAVPEELLFRGLVQGFLRRATGKPWTAILVASVFFGATHLNNEPLYDWRFFVLATIAGVFYGWCYERTRNLFAPALLHAAVDVVWLLLLHV